MPVILQPTFTIQFILVAVLCWVGYSCNTQSSDNLSLEQKAGQLLMVGFKGFELADTSHVKRDIEEYNVGGVILFDFDVPTGSRNRNIESADQVQTLNQSLQSIAGTPLLIAVDQEGGRVARLKTERNFPATVSAEYLGDLNSPDSTRAYAFEQTELLKDIGFNVNFAPVVDLNTNPENPVIGQLDRSYSADPSLSRSMQGLSSRSIKTKTCCL